MIIKDNKITGNLNVNGDLKANSFETNDNKQFLPLSGGALTGDVTTTLSNNQFTLTSLVNKSYVDSAIGQISGGIPDAGNTTTGNFTLTRKNITLNVNTSNSETSEFKVTANSKIFIYGYYNSNSDYQFILGDPTSSGLGRLNITNGGINLETNGALVLGTSSSITTYNTEIFGGKGINLTAYGNTAQNKGNISVVTNGGDILLQPGEGASGESLTGKTYYGTANANNEVATVGYVQSYINTLNANSVAY